MTTSAVGIVLPTMSERGTVPGDVAAAARHAEELGFESVWVIDQLVAGTGVPLLDSGIALQKHPDKVGADESRRAGYKNWFHGIWRILLPDSKSRRAMPALQILKPRPVVGRALHAAFHSCPAGGSLLALFCATVLHAFR